jgi:hypothetical protein
MHVCLIFDKAGLSYTKDCFERKKNLEALFTEAKELTRSVVVFGTALTRYLHRECKPIVWVHIRKETRVFTSSIFGLLSWSD